MRKKPHVCVELAGGLGNQLFQLAAGLSCLQSPTERLDLDWHLGKPRLNSKNLPALSDYILPLGVTVRPKNFFSFIGSKSFGYLMRMSSAPRSYEKNRIIRKLIIALGSFALFLYFKTYRAPLVSERLGYSEIVIPRKKVVLVGYFQSYRYLMDNGVIERLKEMRLTSPSEQVRIFRQFAEEDRPLVVHFRLGDYLSEEKFGIPDKRYYEKAISMAWNTGQYKKIWVFSDDLEAAKPKFPNEFMQHAKWIEPASTSAAENLEIMRLGHGFVIANSTFSYWAATLSANPKADVIAPSPWFKKLESPEDLLPPAWVRVEAWSDLEGQT
jgi:hypothetical protein